MHIEDTERLIIELEMLKVVLYMVSKKRQPQQQEEYQQKQQQSIYLARLIRCY